jgi:hypothetical protein
MMLRHAEVFVIELGRNPQENLATILAFLEKEGLGIRK